MRRRLANLRLILPLLVALAAAAIKLQAGQWGLPLILVLLGGALLGWAAALVLESTALLAFGPSSHKEAAAVVPFEPGARPMLEQQLELTSIKAALAELEDDLARGHISEKAAAPRRHFWREQIATLELQQKEAQQEEARIERAIEEELARRLATQKGALPP